MKLLFILALTLSFQAFSQSRSPAVEPFVEKELGFNNEETSITNKELGQKAAYKFEPKVYSQSSPEVFPWSTLLILVSFLVLPFVTWNVIINKEQVPEKQKYAGLQIIKGGKDDSPNAPIKNDNDDDEDDDYQSAA